MAFTGNTSRYNFQNIVFLHPQLTCVLRYSRHLHRIFSMFFSVTAPAQHTLLYKELNKFVQQIIKYVLSINRKSDYRLE